jgi:hypothetical protein
MHSNSLVPIWMAGTPASLWNLGVDVSAIRLLRQFKLGADSMTW